MTFRDNGPLFRDLTLEIMCLQQMRRQRLILQAVRQKMRGKHLHNSFIIKAKHREQAKRPVGLRSREKVHQPRARTAAADNLHAKLCRRQDRHIGQCNAGTVK